MQMEQTIFIVPENGSNVEVCAILNSQDCRPEVPVPIRIYTTPDSAGRVQEYNHRKNISLCNILTLFYFNILPCDVISRNYRTKC